MDWTVTSNDAGRPLLEYLQGRLPDAPKGYLTQLLRKDRIRVNNRFTSTQPDQKLAPGDRIHLPDSDRLQGLLQRAEVRVLDESDRWVVVFKPAGMPVHRAAGDPGPDVQQILTERFQSVGAPYRLAPVHRLDRGTSGPVLFGKGKAALGALGQCFRDRTVTKIYLALVQGRPPQRGELASPVTTRGKSRMARATYRTLASGHGTSLLLLHLETGRTHQLRQQLADLGHPIVGDRRYGDRDTEGSRLALHAALLAWPDPFEGTNRRITCPPDPSLQTLLLTASGLQEAELAEITQQILQEGL